MPSDPGLGWFCIGSIRCAAGHSQSKLTWISNTTPSSKYVPTTNNQMTRCVCALNAVCRCNLVSLKVIAQAADDVCRNRIAVSHFENVLTLRQAPVNTNSSFHPNKLLTVLYAIQLRKEFISHNRMSVNFSMKSWKYTHCRMFIKSKGSLLILKY